jgi:hypothetical protein
MLGTLMPFPLEGAYLDLHLKECVLCFLMIARPLLIDCLPKNQAMEVFYLLNSSAEPVMPVTRKIGKSFSRQ